MRLRPPLKERGGERTRSHNCAEALSLTFFLLFLGLLFNYLFVLMHLLLLSHWGGY